ncbi:hypothetical protein GCM10028803_15860 [Larkinella knui]|uniref:Uncharacterized protein n=1 Tax=Larkinella knui TaxID=2025310 RepID=A0A3P1C9H0_9BACT|nr:hypothetical protein [Larkinella knui]RRB09955.1 hypothetical protein EHT87_31035 [Larkinella knui]
MSWKGAMRSFSATARRIERDQQRRARLAAQEYKQLQKQQAVENATQAVQAYNDYIEVIKSVHQDCSDQIDWAAMMHEPPPVLTRLSNANELSAQAALNNYQPSLFDRLLKRGPAKIQRLEEAVVVAHHRDQQLARENQEEYNRLLIEWQDRQDLTREVLAKNSDVYANVFEIFSPFENINYLGAHLEFTFTSDHIEVDVQVNTSEVIPDFAVTQLANGKLSRKSLPISKFNEFYQDYVCGCLLRVAREVQAHLPVSQVVVHALVDQLNPATGQVENQVIVSAAIPRAILRKLNFNALDPSDSMQNFNHTMKFTKTAGFQAVERVGLAAPLPINKKR